MKRRRKAGRRLPRVAVLAQSGAELERYALALERLVAAVADLETLLAAMRRELDRLTSVPATGRRRPVQPGDGRKNPPSV